MKNLFAQIESELASPDHQDGWCSIEKAYALASTIMTLRPNLVVEVGVWAGRSVIPVALTLKKLGKGKQICIDPWSASDSAGGLVEGKDKDWWASVDHERVFGVFKKWVADTQIEPYVEIHRCRNDEFNVEKTVKQYGLLDFFHLDGQHGEIASNYDVDHYASNVRVGGFLFFDDIGWAKIAFAKLPSMGFKVLYYLDTGAMCQRLNYAIN